ncbi:hypothetical protein Tco_0540545 [Tanacetum coccineum]
MPKPAGSIQVCNDYGVIVDAFIPYKKSKAERKPSSLSHPSNANERNSPGSYVSTLKSSKTNNVMSDHVLPSLILDDSCISDRDFSLSLMGKVKDIISMPNLYVILEKEGFQNLSLTYLGGLWVLIETISTFAKEKLLNHTGVGSWFSSLKLACNSFVNDERIIWISLEGFPLKVHAKEMEALDPFICNDSYESESSDDEEDAEDDGSQSEDKVTTDNDVERVSKSSCMHNNDLLYDNNHNNIMLDKEKVLSEDPFNLYDILNKRKDSGDDLKYPSGFIASVINVEEVNKKEKGDTNNEVNEHVNSTSNKLEESVPKGKLSSNNNVCSKRVHTCGSILQLMDELVKISIQSKLSDIDTILNQGGSNEEILSDRSLLLKELNDINSIDSLEAAQKSKLAIRRTLVDGKWIVDLLSLEQQADLEQNVSNEEIKSAVWDCGMNKSPGHVGFTFEFFRRYWKLLEHDIMLIDLALSSRVLLVTSN